MLEQTQNKNETLTTNNNTLELGKFPIWRENWKLHFRTKSVPQDVIKLYAQIRTMNSAHWKLLNHKRDRINSFVRPPMPGKRLIRLKIIPQSFARWTIPERQEITSTHLTCQPVSTENHFGCRKLSRGQGDTLSLYRYSCIPIVYLRKIQFPCPCNN